MPLLLDGFNGGTGGIPFPDEIVSYWKLDEASGNAIDTLGNQDLTAYGTIASSSTGILLGPARGPFADGNPGTAFSALTGSSATVYDPTQTTDKFLVEVWFKMTSGSTGIKQIIGKGNDGINAGWIVTMDVNEKLSLRVGSITAVSTTTINDGNIYYGVCWYNGPAADQVKVYVNNVEEGTSTRNTAWPATAVGLSIGAYNTSTSDPDTFLESMDGVDDIVFEAAYWDLSSTTKTDAEIEAILTERYNSGQGQFYTDAP